MNSPLIAITTRKLGASIIPEIPATLRALSLDAVISDYATSVIGAGGTPVLIARDTPIDKLLSRVDGVILSGGEDVTPTLYGREAGLNATASDRERDQYEISLISAAIERGIPILGICRGTQILNVSLGGSLVAHLEQQNGFSHATTEMGPDVRRHRISIQEGSQLARAVSVDQSEVESIMVNSFHHQAVDRPGNDLTIVARAEDGTVEGIEVLGSNVLGVQWHPEMHDGVDPIFLWLCNAAKEFEQSKRERNQVWSLFD